MTATAAPTTSTLEGDAQSKSQLTIAGHLTEARKRLMRAALALVIATIAGFFLTDAVLDVLREPILALAETRSASLNYDSVTGAFDLKVQIALGTGFILASPVWLYQLFAFLTPGLTRREKRYTFGFVLSAVPLFAAGCATGFWLFPHIIELMAGLAPAEDSSILLADYYFDFVMKLILASGIAFVAPVLVLLLNFLGVLSAKAIRQQWRVAVIAIIVFCAIATPAADVFSMFLLAIPLFVLSLLAGLIAYLHDRARDRRVAAAMANTDF